MNTDYINMFSSMFTIQKFQYTRSYFAWICKEKGKKKLIETIFYLVTG